ncbi:RNA polymerase sigma factor [Benzoatithermus flavus]|uniref:Sigma-70 family RNA polymerase sigma factor n=1 Tax=Benzoatithermus flavus TaxID=3108223 RepID=A0ABU8XWE3_9PROT
MDEEELVALLPNLRRFARVLCRDDAEADDLVQSTCERALRRADGFAPGTRLDRWLFKMMQNLWLDRARSAATRHRHVDLDAARDLVGADGSRDGEARVMLARVRARIAALPEQQRLVLALVVAEGLGYREAAERLGVPIGTVMSRLARARRSLFDLVGEGGSARGESAPSCQARW